VIWLTTPPGSYFSVWGIDRVCCGALICYDYRYPELHRGTKRGVRLVFTFSMPPMPHPGGSP
jgi:predicted amidohydrolase